MIYQSLSRKYAKALLELAREDNKENEYIGDLKDFYGFIKDQADLWNYLTGPVGLLEKKRAILEAILEKTKYSLTTKNFLRLLLDNDRVFTLGEIIDTYDKLLDEAQGKARATIVSATTLSDSEVDAITVKLSKVIGKKIVSDVSVDQSIIGGVIAYVGGFVFDGSIKTQLEIIRENLKKGQL